MLRQELTRPEMAVLMLLSLDEAVAAPIVAEMSAVELKRLREVAQDMADVPANAMSLVYTEFLARAKDVVALPRGGVAYLRHLTNRALGESRSQEIFLGTPMSALDRVSMGDPNTIGSLLETEHPQLVACLLSQMMPDKAAEIVAALSQEKQAEVVARWANLEEVPTHLVEQIAQALSEELPSADRGVVAPLDGIDTAAQVLRRIDNEASNQLLERISESQGDIADKLRASMFTVEDLRALPARSLRLVLKEVPQDQLILALKTASEELKQKIFASMSQRASELLKDELENMGGVRLADVEAAHASIVEAARRLEGDGTISLTENSDLV